jgi:hypothetical protein
MLQNPKPSAKKRQPLSIMSSLKKNTPAYERFSHDTIDAAQNPKPQARNDSLNVKSQKKLFGHFSISDV